MLLLIPDYFGGVQLAEVPNVSSPAVIGCTMGIYSYWWAPNHHHLDNIVVECLEHISEVNANEKNFNGSGIERCATV